MAKKGKNVKNPFVLKTKLGFKILKKKKTGNCDDFTLVCARILVVRNGSVDNSSERRGRVGTRRSRNVIAFSASHTNVIIIMYVIHLL